MRSKKLLLTINRSRRHKQKIIKFEPIWERKERVVYSKSYGPAITFEIKEHSTKRKNER